MDSLLQTAIGREVRDVLSDVYDRWLDDQPEFIIDKEKDELAKQDRMQWLLGDDRELGRAIVEGLQRVGLVD